ncbi:MAG: sodium-dependent transporter [Planctomycetota bacterium]
MSEAPPPQDRFSSRFALLMAALGMAIGAGNIWRFPRIMGKFEDGGTFLIPWAIFLFSWSIPLLIVETAIGRRTRLGVLGSMRALMGRHAWIGSFVALCTIGIMAYYAVIAGWCGTYVVESLRGAAGGYDYAGAVEHFTEVGQGPVAVLATVAAFLVAGFFVRRGLGRGVELANKLLLPMLFVLLVVLVVAGLTREGAGAGFAYMFRVDWAQLGSSPQPWLEALSQSAWSTGAGWGLLLVLSVGATGRSDSVGDAVVTGLGNNLASLLAASATIPAVFALAPIVAPDRTVLEVLQDNGPGNTGMAMIWLPRLFQQVGAAGPWLSAAFFLALTFAATTSLIAMVELGTRTFMDLGWTRGRAIVACLVVGLAWGAPSALSLDFLANQDWVWGLGLMVSGVLFSVALAFLGFERFRTGWLPGRRGGPALGVWFTWVLALLVPLQFVLLLGWWFWQTASGHWAEEQWSPLETYSVGTCVIQWALAFLLLWLIQRFGPRRAPADGTGTPTG